MDDISLKWIEGTTPKTPTPITSFEPEADPYIIPAEKAQSYDTMDLKLTDSFNWEGQEVKNAIHTQSLCADPTAIEVDGKLYVYGTREQKSYGDDTNPSLDKNAGKVIDNAYQTDKLSVFSTTDLVNWTDEGYIDMKALGVTWASRSWAPSICRYDTKGDGKYEYFLFFTNSGSVGYLRGASPTGPWKDDLKKPLIVKSDYVPELDGVYWNFDPSVLVDSQNDMYIYWGGGNVGAPTAEQFKHPKSSRAAKLNVTPEKVEVIRRSITELDAYYIFEDSEINQIDGKYVYTYCTNWNVESNPMGVANAQIAGYISDDPLNITADPENSKVGDPKYLKTIFENPGGKLYGHWYNNHHRITKFKNKYYMIYHTTGLDKFLYKDDPVYKEQPNGSFKYRNLSIDEITTMDVTGDNPSIKVTPTLTGPAQVEKFNPYKKINATTQSMMAGLTTKMLSDGTMVLDKIDTGDWTRIDGVDFGNKTNLKLEAVVASETTEGSIEVYLDKALTGTKIATISLKKTDGKYEPLVANLDNVNGVHDVYFVFRGVGYNVASWTFLETV